MNFGNKPSTPPDPLSLENHKQKQSLELESLRIKGAKELESFKQEAAKALETLKVGFAKQTDEHKLKLEVELERKKFEISKEMETYKFDLSRKLEELKTHSNQATEKLKSSWASDIEHAKQDSNYQIELLRLRKQLWDKTIDTQMHFNEMSVKSRQLGLSFVVAALGLSVVLLGKSEGVIMSLPLKLIGSKAIYSTHVSGLIVLVAAAGLYGVRRLDLGVYHRMLRGAVTFGEELEKKQIKHQLSNTKRGLTETVSFYSRHNHVEKLNGGEELQGIGNVTAESKIARFYTIGIGALIVIGIAIILSFSSLAT